MKHRNTGFSLTCKNQFKLQFCSRVWRKNRHFSHEFTRRKGDIMLWKKASSIRSWSFYNFIFDVANGMYSLPVFISFSCMKCCHSMHFLVGQFEVKYADVFKDMIGVLWTRYRNISCLQMPAKDYLSWSLSMSFGDLHDSFISVQILCMTSAAEGIPWFDYSPILWYIFFGKGTWPLAQKSAIHE